MFLTSVFLKPPTSESESCGFDFGQVISEAKVDLDDQKHLSPLGVFETKVDFLPLLELL